MRKSRVIALAVASLVSAASFAQAQTAAPVAMPQHAMRGQMQHARGQGGMLKGITLSAAEKAQLKTIHAKYATEGKSLRESLKPAMKEARTARQKGDTAGFKAVVQRNEAGRDQLQALRTREQADIRAALTPSNQTLLDANIAAQAQRGHASHMKGMKRMKRMKKGHGHHQRPAVKG